MSLAPVLLYAGGRRGSPRRITTVQGVDIADLLVSASGAAGIPTALLLGCLMAESELDARAERWGPAALTAQAKAALANDDLQRLRAIIPLAGNDISFGLGQRIVKFHYHGNGQLTLENILDVRQFVFDNTDTDVREAARLLASCLTNAGQADLTPVGGDRLLGACVAYNNGHVPPPGDAYWTARAATVGRYAEKLQQARQLLGA